MSKVLVPYYSTYGHIETMARAMAEGARSTGAQVDLKRVPETVPPELAKTAHFKLDQDAPVATVAELADYDAIIVGAPTRFGRMPAQCDRADRGTSQGMLIAQTANGPMACAVLRTMACAVSR